MIYEVYPLFVSMVYHGYTLITIIYHVLYIAIIICNKGLRNTLGTFGKMGCLYQIHL